MSDFIFNAESSYGLKNVVSIDNSVLKDIKFTCTSNIQVITAVETLISHIIGNGIEISLLKFGEKVKESDKMRTYTEREVLPFLREYIWNILVFGFDIYIKKPSEIIKGLYMPEHPRFDDWSLIFGYKNFIRKYKILKTNYTDGVISYNHGSVFKSAYTSIIYNPDDDGRLTSPLANLVPYINRLNLYWENLDNVSSSLANPPFVVQINNNKSNSSTQSSTMGDLILTHYSEDDGLELGQRRERRMNEFERKEAMISTMVSQLNREGFAVARFDQHTQRTRYETKGESWKNPVVLPRGQQVASTTQPSNLNSSDRLIDMIIGIISSLIGVSQNNNSNQKAKYAANAELELRFLNDRVSSFQNKLVPEIQKLFENIWSKFLDDNKKEQVKKLKDQMNLKDIKLDKLLQKDLEDESIKIDISFRYTPLTSFDRLIELNERAIIDDNTFAKYAGKISGIYESDILDEKERELLLKKRKLEEIKDQENQLKLQSKFSTNNNKEEGDNNKKEENNNNNKDDNDDIDKNSGKKRKRDDKETSGGMGPEETKKNPNKKQKTKKKDSIDKAEKKRKKTEKKVAN
jgi:hypothetical protein